jgi:hypothetical protein
VRLTDAMGSEAHDRDGSDLVDNGLFIDHTPWRFNVFEVKADRSSSKLSWAACARPAGVA